MLKNDEQVLALHVKNSGILWLEMQMAAGDRRVFCTKRTFFSLLGRHHFGLKIIDLRFGAEFLARYIY
jgi:hypothetical protein